MKQSNNIATDLPSVSVVITTKNEEKNIETCLKSISLQSYSNLEIIVVDNSSTDNTKVLARKYTNLVFDKGPERSAQRNFGMIDKAKGDLVMFVDADMILAPYLIESAVMSFQSSNHVGLYLPEIVLGRKFWSKVRRFERTFYDGTPIDGSRFFSKKIVATVKGFDENLYACEDWDLDKRLKQLGTIGLITQKPKIDQGVMSKWSLSAFIKKRGADPFKYPVVIYHNESEFDLRKYLGKKDYYSQNFDIYQKKWAGDPDIKKQFGISYRFFGVFFENGKWLRLISHPILSLGMYFLRFLVGWQFIGNKLKGNLSPN